MAPLLLSAFLATAPPTPGETVAFELGVPGLAGLPDVPRGKRPDDVTVEQVRRSPEKYPVRIAVLNAAESVRKTYKLKPKLELLQNRLEAEKKPIQDFQRELATAILLMQEATSELTTAYSKRTSEPSERWLAHLDFLLAFTKLRMGMLEEMNLAYGSVHRNELPKVEGKDTGWILSGVEKMHSKGEIRSLVEEAHSEFAAIIKAQAGTPWAKLAERELNGRPGYTWVSAEVKPPPPPPKLPMKKKRPK